MNILKNKTQDEIAKHLNKVPIGDFLSVININKYYLSSQVSNRCEYKNEEVKGLSVRRWICPVCGFEHDRDIMQVKI